MIVRRRRGRRGSVKESRRDRRGRLRVRSFTTAWSATPPATDNNLKEHVYYRVPAPDGHGTALRGKRRSADISQPLADERGRQAALCARQSDAADRTSSRSATSTARDRKVLASQPARAASSACSGHPRRTHRSPPSLFDGKPKVTYLADRQVREGSARRSTRNSADHFVDIADLSEDGPARFSSVAASDRDPGTLRAVRSEDEQPVARSTRCKPWFKAEQMGERMTVLVQGLQRRPNSKASSPSPADAWQEKSACRPHRPWRTARYQRRLDGLRAAGKTWKRSSSPRAAMPSVQVELPRLGRARQELRGLRQAANGHRHDAGHARRRSIGPSGPGLRRQESRLRLRRELRWLYALSSSPYSHRKELFKCSVAIAGVSDIRIQADRSDTRRSRARTQLPARGLGHGRSGLRRGELRRSTTSTNSMCRCCIVHGEDDHARADPERATK